jgi:hypothetical protein
MSSSGSVRLRYEKCLEVWGNANANAQSERSSLYKVNNEYDRAKDRSELIVQQAKQLR